MRGSGLTLYHPRQVWIGAFLGLAALAVLAISGPMANRYADLDLTRRFELNQLAASPDPTSRAAIPGYALEVVAGLDRPPMGNGGQHDGDGRIVLSRICNHGSAPGRALGYTSLIYYDEADGQTHELCRFELGEHWESPGDIFRTEGGLWQIAPEILGSIATAFGGYDPANQALSTYAPDLGQAFAPLSRTQYPATSLGGGGRVGFAAYQAGVQVLGWGLPADHPGWVVINTGDGWSEGCRIGGYPSAAYVDRDGGWVYFLCPWPGQGAGLWRVGFHNGQAERIGDTPNWSWGWPLYDFGRMVRFSDVATPQAALFSAPGAWRDILFFAPEGKGYRQQALEEVPGPKGAICQHPLTGDWLLWTGGVWSHPEHSLKPWTCAAYVLRLRGDDLAAYQVWRGENFGGAWSMAAVSSHQHAYMATGRPDYAPGGGSHRCGLFGGVV